MGLFMMDAVPCHWNGASGQESFPRPRPVAVTLSRLAELMARVEHKQEMPSPKPQQSGSSICKDCGQEFSELTLLARHQQREHALHKPHRCPHCGQKFALASTLQLHKCLSASSVCQVCSGTPQLHSPCPSCLAEAPGPRSPEEQSQLYNSRLHHDSSPYACAPCGKSFSHKQELLYHQQAGGCQPAPLSPKVLCPPPAVLPLTPDDEPTPSSASLPPSTSVTSDYPSTCGLCRKTFRSAAGLACHRRLVHLNMWRKKNVSVTTEKLDQQAKGPLFPCRTCDKVFSQTSLLYLHRKEEHRREKQVKRQQRISAKSTRQRKKGETYPCLHCGKVFLHHLTRYAHFRNYSSHYQTHLANSGKLAKMSKAGKGLEAAKVTPIPKKSKDCKIVMKNSNVKRHINLRSIRHEVKHEEEPEQKDEDGEDEFPCPSCEEVFHSQSALKKHEELHQSSDAPNHCSVCTGGIILPQDTDPEHRVYHCVPCRDAFVDLDTFLQHCRKTHLSTCDDEDDDQLSDD